MHEKRIQEIMEIEKQAQALLDAATREAEALPKRAEQEAQDLIEEARTSAREEARRLLDQAVARAAVADIVSKAELQVREMESMGEKNLDRAVRYVLDRVAGKQ
jgi:vacuolar-type H+-ATPase subunit H